MVESFLPRVFVMVFGYAYPAYECYKTLENNKPDIEQLVFWCQYWILVAMLTVLERIGDALFAWLPIYCEAKLALLIYLWSSKVKGTSYLYNHFFRNFVSQHELEIDSKILEFRVKTGDIANYCCQKALIYGHKGVSEIFQYVSSHSESQPRRDQKQGECTERVIASGQSEAEATDQRTRESKFEDKPTESVTSSGNGMPIPHNSKRWLRKLMRRCVRGN